MAAFCKPLMTLLCMQLGLATSLLKYKPEMHDSWVDPKVRPLQFFNILCMYMIILQLCIGLPAAAYYRFERIAAARLLLTRACVCSPRWQPCWLSLTRAWACTTQSLPAPTARPGSCAATSLTPPWTLATRCVRSQDGLMPCCDALVMQCCPLSPGCMHMLCNGTKRLSILLIVASHGHDCS